MIKMGLNEKQKSEISNLILHTMDDKLKTYVERDDMNKPFYSALFSKKSVYIASILQSTYTSFGSQWENIAEIIGKGNPNIKRFEKHYRLEGTITPKEQETISDILFELDRDKNKIPKYEIIKKRLYNSYQKGDKEKPINQIIDFFIELKDGHEIYFENKSVKPNKNEMKAAKNDLLEILAMRQKVKNIDMIDVAVSMPYNPYFDKSFERWTTIKFFESGKDIFIGDEFWDFLGGKNTYIELLDIFSDVGGQVSESLDDFIGTLEDNDFYDIKYNQ